MERNNPYVLPNGEGRTHDRKLELYQQIRQQFRINNIDDWNKQSPETIKYIEEQNRLIDEATSPVFDKELDYEPEYKRVEREKREAEKEMNAAMAATQAKDKLEANKRATDKRQREAPYKRKEAIEDWRVAMERDARIGLAFARKEKAIGRKLNESEKKHYIQTGEYPASQAERQKKQTEQRHETMARLDFNHLPDNKFGAEERQRRIKEARGRTPLETAIRNLFTPYSKQVPKKYLQN